MKLFLVQDGKTTGPYTAAEARSRLASGEISGDTLAATEGSDEWRPVGDILPDDKPEEKPKAEPPRLKTVSPVEARVEMPDPNENERDVRRYPPEQEERIRTGAWLAVGLLYLLAFLWPTQMAGGWGVVNFEFAWVSKNLSWSAIPLMVWPGVAGLAMIAAGIFLRGRIRGAIAIFLALAPVVLILMVSTDGFVTIMGAFSSFEGVDLSSSAGREAALGKVSEVLRGLMSMLLAGVMGFVLLVGAASSVYVTLLLAPHAVRHLRPNFDSAHYFAVIGGIFLIIVLLLGLLLGLLSLAWSFVGGLFLELGLVLQLAAVIVGFINFTDRPAKHASRRARLALALGVGGMVLIGLTLLLVPLAQEGLRNMIGSYFFKLYAWYTAAALALPLAVMDLWLGKAAETPQND